MPLYLVTSSRRNDTAVVEKGELYNLDLNERFNFMYNPESFSMNRQTVYSEVTWRGAENGGSSQFSHIGETRFQLSLLFTSDVGSPKMEYDAGDGRPLRNLWFPQLDIIALIEMIERWERKVPGLNRPSQISVIMGRISIDAVIRKSEIKIMEYDNNYLQPKEVVINLRFRA